MNLGHTGITWGIPGDVETAYREVAALGYDGFETFTETIISANRRPGGYRRLIDRFGIPTSAGYCYKEWTDPDTARQELDEARREVDALRALPGSVAVVLQAGSRPGQGAADDGLRALADALNGFGAYCREIGLMVGLHPHTGTAVESRAEIDRILHLLEPGLVGFAPDTGQLAKVGSDVIEVLRTHRERIVHVHLKDWNGRRAQADGTEVDESGYLNYEAVGDGVLPMREILALLSEDGGFDGWVNVELDGTQSSRRPPADAAARSLRYLEQAIGRRRTRARSMPIEGKA